MKFSCLHKRAATLIAIQAACLLVGIWLHGLILSAAIEWSCEQQARTELSGYLDRLTQAAGAAALKLERSPASDELAETFAAVAHRGDLQWLLVDPGWRPITASDDAPVAAEQGATLSWEPVIAGIDEPADSIRQHGLLHLALGAYPAVAAPLGDGRLRVVVLHRSHVLAPASAVRRHLPAIGAVSVAWIVMLQAAVGYLLLKRIGSDHDKVTSQSAHDINRQAQDIARTRDAIIFGLAKLAESRDRDTGQHLERIARYSTRLASALQSDWRYRQQVTPEFVHLIGTSSALHDIGKVGLPDSVLLKRGPLTESERRAMQRHTSLGAACLSDIDRRLGDSSFLVMARQIALCHHEQWDGSGYPNGLSGENIPLAARIVGLVDVYDALASVRPYKTAVPHNECVEYIRTRAGTHFDPSLVEVFLKIEGQFQKIAAARVQPSTGANPAAGHDERAAATPPSDSAPSDLIASDSSPSDSTPRAAVCEELNLTLEPAPETTRSEPSAPFTN
jgi:HD-GYP domain-containing protein (c-di-GMP phosphodiesterase class II)